MALSRERHGVLLCLDTGKLIMMHVTGDKGTTCLWITWKCSGYFTASNFGQISNKFKVFTVLVD
jgi:hypothetical protein